MATSTPAGVRGDAGSGDTAGHAAPMSHRQIIEALSGLLLGMFVAILSSTIVSNALPQIIADLGGGQSAYTWVVTASLLSMTATTPLWGKLADLTSKKVLVQLSLVIFVLASAGAGLAHSPAMLITFRAIQGLGMGGLTALTQVVIAAMIPPRQRGRYSGYLGATFAVATVGGPLLGGVITDTSWLGWRWCFYVGVPFAIIALIVLQKTLKLPVLKREVKVDWAGAFFISAAASLLLIWVSLAGDQYAWNSWQTYTMVGGSLLLGLLFVWVESKASQPIIPLRLFRNRTITLTSLASLFVGVAMFGATVFLSQYFQLARGKSPTMSGLMTIPMVAGLFLSSTGSGLIITKTGRWKRWLVSGSLLLTAGLGLLGTMRHDTEYWRIGTFMALVGLGVGMMMQNLVLATQNQVEPEDLGSASSVVAFFRSLGGAIGVSALGAVLGTRIPEYIKDGLPALGPEVAAKVAKMGDTGTIPNVRELPEPIRSLFESAYGHGIADIYLYAAPIALLAVLLVLFIKEVPLRTTNSSQQSAPDGDTARESAPVPAAAPAVTAAVPSQSSTGEHALAGVAARQEAAEPAPAAVYASADGGGTPPGGTVHGFVRNTDGIPVAQAAITLISPSGQQLGRSVSHGDGAYSLDTPGPGSYVLIASADRHQPQASTVVVGEQPLGYDLVLCGTGGLAGTVRDAAGGQPVVDALVVVTDDRGEVLATGRTAENGRFAFAELIPGSFTIAVNAVNHRPLAMPVEISGQGVTRIDVELFSGALVQGTVLAGAEHRPLPDARVTLVDAAGNVVATSTTGDDGAYAFTDLDAGDYTIIASGYPPTASPLSVSARGVDGYDIELGHPGE
ncbi:MFS transporter [Streptomyces sp. TP-A0874]|uniref:MFS transporter n=1 Tax=Streptomyces sp. TP-A0874 TaxID=549819 RepID=UPI000853AAE6|nr:MFS transporter [Streptomyces sp. TP-A0874]